MSFLQRLVLAVFLSFFTIQSYSQDWKPIAFNEEIQDTTYEYQNSSIVKSIEAGRPGTFKIWFRHLEKKIEIVSNHYRNVKVMTLWICDCAQNQFRIQNLIYYDSNGEVIQSVQNNKEWNDGVPGSLGQSLLTFFCKINRTKGGIRRK